MFSVDTVDEFVKLLIILCWYCKYAFLFFFTICFCLFVCLLDFILTLMLLLLLYFSCMCMNLSIIICWHFNYNSRLIITRWMFLSTGWVPLTEKSRVPFIYNISKLLRRIKNECNKCRFWPWMIKYKFFWDDPQSFSLLTIIAVICWYYCLLMFWYYN